MWKGGLEQLPEQAVHLFLVAGHPLLQSQGGIVGVAQKLRLSQTQVHNLAHDIVVVQVVALIAQGVACHIELLA